MVEGRYLFDLDISRERIKLRTDVDKREGHSLKDSAKESDRPLNPPNTAPTNHQVERGGTSQ
jgi:hypothetical protein